MTAGRRYGGRQVGHDSVGGGLLDERGGDRRRGIMDISRKCGEKCVLREKAKERARKECLY